MADEKQPDQMCRHIAVIMDGNGRWAKQRGKIRSFGHKEGLKATKRVAAGRNALRRAGHSLL